MDVSPPLWYSHNDESFYFRLYSLIFLVIVTGIALEKVVSFLFSVHFFAVFHEQ